MIRSILFAIVLSFAAQANAFISIDLKTNVNYFQEQAEELAISTQGLPWIVGEKSNYNMKMAIFDGTMVMEVKEETDAGFWVHQNMDLMGQNNLVEMLFNKETGEVLEVIVNGKKEDLPEQGDAEVVEQREEQITVVAGTFDAMYVKMRTDGKDSELWVNPIDVPVFGLIKQIAPSQFGPVTLELTGFTDL